MATPSLAMIPSAYADSKVYSVLPNNGDGDFTFNRDSSATRVGQNGLIQEVGFFGSQLVNSWTNNNFSLFASNGSNITQMVSSGNGNNCYSLATFTSGKTYELKFTSSQSINANVRISNNVNLTSAQVIFTTLTSGTNYITFTANSNYSYIGFYASNSFTDTQITEFIAREIQGDQPRLNYDISNGVVQSCPSLLLEPASTNLINYSQAISNSPIKNGTFVDNAAISPDGTLNATKLTATTADPFFYQSITFAAASYTSSIYVKGIGDSIGKDFRISIGSFTTAPKLIVPSEWTRFEFTATLPSGSATTGIEITDPAIVGDEVLVWGWQVEEQSYPTSYIPTNGQSGGVTRAAESCQKTGLTNYIGQTEGTLFCEINFKSHTEAGSPIVGIVCLNNNVTNLQNCIILGIERQSGGVNRFFPFVQVGNSTVASIIGPTLTDGVYKAAFAYKQNDFVLYVNGVQIGTDSSGAVPTTSQVLVGQRFNGDSFILGDGIKSTQIFKTRLTNTQLQTLTTL